MRADVLTPADAECAVAGACLLERAARDAARLLLRASDFALPEYGEIVAAMWALDDRGAAVDPLTVADELTRRGSLAHVGGKDFVAYLIDSVPTAAHVAHHAAIVRDAARRRALAAVADELASQARDPGATVESAASAAQGALLPLGVDPDATGAGFRTMKEGLWDVMESVESRCRAHRSGDVIGVPTGYPELDAIFAGFRPGELIIPAAVPKAGKTSLALNVALFNALEGREVGIVSAEMLRGELTEACLSALSGVRRHAIAAGTLRDDDFPALARAAGLLSGAPLYIDDEAFPTLDDVIARSLHLKATHPGLSLLVVDYLQLVTKRLGSNRRGDEEINEVCRGLKGLAKRLGVPVLAPAQVNYKDVEKRENKRPTAADLQGASGMAQAANAVLLLYRDQMYSPDARGPDTLEVEVALSRRTDRASVTLGWDGARMRVTSPALGGHAPYAVPAAAAPSRAPLTLATA